MQMSTFSKVFRINKSQAELDFIDVLINSDTPLFIDPYAISQRRDAWSISCHELIKYFFQLIVESIRAKNHNKAKELLFYLKEPNETHLGFSKKRPQGAGIGRYQAEQLYQAISESSAVKTGFLSSLEECELMIDGISRDKISDLTTNIIRKKLEEYTIAQCDLYNIPIHEVALPPFFSQDENAWVSNYYHLPIYKNKPILLIPKFIARYSLDYDSGDYYNSYVLNFLQAENLSARSSLVRTLKNGKRVVYKKDLKAKYPFSKEFLFAFSKNNPKVLAEYKAALSDLEKDHNEINEGSESEHLLADTLLLALRHIPPGADYASSYHNLMLGILEFIFYPYLIYPRKEKEIHDGRKRIDIVVENGAKSGIFRRLHEIRSIHCPFISIECKNYKTEIANPEIDQLSGRFSRDRGFVGIMCCRSFEDEKLFLKRCIDTFKDGRGLIMYLNDARIAELLTLIKNNNRNQIDSIITGYFDAVHFS
jgi:hypothetical protein